MKKRLSRRITQHKPYLAGICVSLAVVLPILSLSSRPASTNEEVLVSLSRGLGSVLRLRVVILLLILINLSLVYGLFTSWFAKRRAGLSVLILSCIPSWLLMQIAVPRFTLLLTSSLFALWAFDKAGRSDKPTGWYVLSGLSVTAAWLQEPVGTSILIAICSLLLLAVKPRYVRHISRQASLVLIILGTAIAALSAAAWKFNLSIQDHLVQQIGNSVRVTAPQLYWDGAVSYHLGLPGVSLVPLACLALAGLGAWQMVVDHRRPRNVYLVILPIICALAAPQLVGLGMLLLLSIAIIAMSTWVVMGIQYLHVSWKRVFPHNKLANTVGDTLIVLMISSLALYSFWFVNKAWNDSPQVRIDAATEWNGGL